LTTVFVEAEPTLSAGIGLVACAYAGPRSLRLAEVPLIGEQVDEDGLVGIGTLK